MLWGKNEHLHAESTYIISTRYRIDILYEPEDNLYLGAQIYSSDPQRLGGLVRHTTH